MAKELKQKQNLSLFLVAFSFARFHRLNTPPVLKVPLAGNIRPLSKPQQNENVQVKSKIDQYIGQQRKWDQQKKDLEIKRLKQLEDAKLKKEARKIQSQKIVRNITSVPSGTLLSTLLSAIIFLIAVVFYVMYAKNISSFFSPSASSSSTSTGVPSFSSLSLASVQGTQTASTTTTSSSTTSSVTSASNSSLPNTQSSTTSSSSTSKVRVENIPLNLFNASDDSNIINISLADVSTNPIQIVVDKVSELPRNYIPTDLIALNVLGGGQLKQEAAKLLSDMFADAHTKGIDLKVLSAFRSYDDQQTLYNYYVDSELKNGAKTQEEAIKNVDKYSARPGHSEHQLGTTADIICSTESDLVDSECNLKAWKYLEENSYKFGFKISYPKNNSYGFNYEPWHIRYWGL